MSLKLKLKPKKRYIEVSHSSTSILKSKCRYCFSGPVEATVMKGKFSYREQKIRNPRTILEFARHCGIVCNDFRRWDKYYYNAYCPETDISISYHSGYLTDNETPALYCKCGMSVWTVGSQKRPHTANRLAKTKQRVIDY